MFIDDILVYSPTLEAQVEHLGTVLQLCNHQLAVKRSKCSFAQNSLEYLGHIISDRAVATDPSKTQAMQRWPQPTQ